MSTAGQPDDRAGWPVIIQGGMGVSISDWRLARAVGGLGQLGVVSGTALDVVVARRLADGDAGGHVRRALAQFPVPELSERVLRRWFSPAGRPGGTPYPRVPMARTSPPPSLRELTIAANFAEVWLAKEGHDGPIGVNYLEKVQLPTPFALYGAMLAGVDFVLMGAGIPAQIPQLLTDLALGQPVEYRITVSGAEQSESFAVRFDPSEVAGAAPPALTRPRFLAVISSNVLASYLCKDPATRPDGFVVEGPTAGGHNAPPRGRAQLDADGQPLYGPRDTVEVALLADLGLPFWLAGGYADPAMVESARRSGAAGVQVGTAFALCEESGLRPDLKQALVDRALGGALTVRTDPLASPSGFPFKVAALPGSLSEEAVYDERQRVCDLGFLRTAYRRSDGSVGYRCPSEPVDAYLAKGGKAEDTVGRKCLCNGLLATAGLAQERDRGPEAPIVTIGADTIAVARALAGPFATWRAEQVVAHLLGAPTA